MSNTDLNSGKRDGVYYLIRDTLASFSANTEEDLISALNDHLISKEAVRQVLKDQIKEKNPNYSIVRGVLIVQNNFLRRKPSIAFYEVLEIINELKYCFRNKKWKTIKKLSAQTILRLFVMLYFEFRMLPMHHKEDEVFIQQFKECFSKEEVAEVINEIGFLSRYIFEQQFIDLGNRVEMNGKLTAILKKFYK